ncbi:MAG: DUF2029 domain-containing protein [Chloroflexi bacterium]|nr:DUF2029 domain-containing protein [Chloroflexota bacterium]
MQVRSIRGAFLGASFACLVLGWAASETNEHYRQRDFFCLWQGARITAGGGDPYDETAWRAETSQREQDLGAPAGFACPRRYSYPLWTAVLMRPFGVVPLALASSAWMALAFTSTLAGIALLWTAVGGQARFAGVFAAIVLTSQPFWVLVVGGQVSGVLLALVGLGVWSLSRQREGLGAAALTALLIKPQVAGIFVPAVVLHRLIAQRPGVVASSAVVALVLLAMRS